MLSKQGNHEKKAGATRLVAIRVTEIDDSLEVTALLFNNILSGSEITPQMVKHQLF